MLKTTGWKRDRAVALVLSALCLLAACATTGERKKDDDSPRDATAESPRVDTLGGVVRMLGERGGNLVLMKGLEGRSIDEELAAKLKTSDAAALAKAAECDVQKGDAYSFIYLDQQPYDILTNVSLEGRMAPVYADKKVTLAVGAGAKLFTALALLGQALDHSFVADNALAETACGELALKDVPVQQALEAILKSSRLVGFGVDSTEEYVFISGDATPAPIGALLNEPALDDAARALLEKRVNVHLPVVPDAPERIVVTVGAETLHTAAASLSRQMGVPVKVQPGLEGLPVNPVVMRNARVRTALDLIVRQWPVAQFGYEVGPDRILIRRK